MLEDGGAELVTIPGPGLCTSVAGVLLALGESDDPARVGLVTVLADIDNAQAQGLTVAESAQDPEARLEIDASDAVALLDSINALVAARVSAGDIAARLREAGLAVRDSEEAGYFIEAFGRIIQYNPGDGREGPGFATLYADDPEPHEIAGLADVETLALDPSEEILTLPVGLVSEHAENYRITDEDVRWVESASPKVKFAANIVALRTLATLDSENREATPDEQKALVRFTGWGAMPQLFNLHSLDWREQRDEFEALVERYGDEWVRARESTQNSHFTSAPIIDAIYGGLARLGFAGGRILEPSLGSGNFLGRMPNVIREHPATRVTGIEMEPVTAAVARRLYPQYPHILNEKFEKARVLDGLYDVVVGNVPFGDYQMYDAALNAKYAVNGRGLRVHNYFIAKSLEKIRDDGMLALITSTGTLEANDAKPFRESLAREAELVGAVRLPEGAFRATAGTDVTVDVIFLRKRNLEERTRIAAGEPVAGPRFLETVVTDVTTYYGDRLSVNEYYREHPHMVLGELAAGGEYGNRVVVKGTGEDVGVALARALSTLPAGVYREMTLPVREPGRDLGTWVTSEGVKNLAYTVSTTDGARQLLVRDGNRLVPVEADPERIDRVEGLLRIRDAVRDVLGTQLTGADLAVQVAAREKLNATYDGFVERYAPVSDPRNRLALKGDPDSYLLLALETYDAKTKRADKAQIFSEAVVARPAPVTRVLTAREAVALSLVEHGDIDVSTVARLVDTSRIAAAELMVAEGAAFRDPVSGRFVASEDYLSGNVREKLETARMVSELDPTFRPNVAALEAAQPEPIPAKDIGIRLGAGWIPPEIISQFLKDTLKVTIAASYVESTAEWVFHSRGRVNLESVANTKEWGTEALTGASLVELALNARVPTVYRVIDDVRLVDTQETEAAREMQSKLRERFKEWAWESDARLEQLETIYNGRFNNFRPRSFATDWYAIPGINPVWNGDTTKGENGLRPHQLAGVSRVATGANTLLAHCVGAGKSFTAVAGTQECVRLGLSRKPLFVVPNQTLVQFHGEFLKLYPAARILAATEGDLSAGNRQEFLSRIATGTWDAVIVAHSSFGMIPLSNDYQQRFIDSRIQALDEALQSARYADADSRVIKKIEAAKKRYEGKLEALADMKKDDTVTFEQLGIDRLVIDESHAFKALEFHTKRGSIAGLSTRASQRAFDLFMKTQYIESIAGQGRGVVFMSGTPVTNTLAEMFTIQRFLQHHELVDRGLAHFDAWASVFTETVTGYESTVANKFELRTRLAEFDNLPELMSLFRGVADVQTAEMLDLPRPGLSGGAAIPVISPISDAQTAYVEDLARRVEDIKAKRVQPAEDNMLKVTTNGREASLDIRLAQPGHSRDPEGKVALVSANVARIWKESAAARSTQIVFCDLGTPTKRGPAKGTPAAFDLGPARFNLYEDIRSAMIENGVAPNEIAFVHDFNTDAKRIKLYAAVNDGTIRVVIGSTPKLGIGVNVQKKLLAIHQLDVPFRPCDIEQRLGRILRQGNEHGTVFEYRYVTQGRGGKPSFDTYLWQLNESKDRFIRQVMSGDAVPRRLEDIAERALTYAEFKAIASGNPLVYEKVKVDNDIVRLERLHNAYLAQRRTMRYEVESHLPHKIDLKHRRLERLTADHRTYAESRPGAGAFAIEVFGRIYSDREEAGTALRSVAVGATIRKAGDVVTLGRYAGLDIALVGSLGGAHFCLLGASIGSDRERYDANFGESAASTIASIEAVARAIARRVEVETGDIARLEREMAETAVLLARPFEHEELLTTLRLRQIAINRELGLTSDDVQVVMEGVGDAGASLLISTAVTRADLDPTPAIAPPPAGDDSPVPESNASGLDDTTSRLAQPPVEVVSETNEPVAIDVTASPTEGPETLVSTPSADATSPASLPQPDAAASVDAVSAAASNEAAVPTVADVAPEPPADPSDAGARELSPVPMVRVEKTVDARSGSPLWVVNGDVRDRAKREAAERVGGNADLSTNPPRFRFRSESAAAAFVASLGHDRAIGSTRSHAIPLVGVTAEQFVDAMPDSSLKRMLLAAAAHLSDGIAVTRSASLAAAYDLVASQNPHRRIIEGAIDAGRDVPARVRADYFGDGPDELAQRAHSVRERWRREELVTVPAPDVPEWRLAPAEKLARMGDGREARAIAAQARMLRVEEGSDWQEAVSTALCDTPDGRLWEATVRKASEDSLEISPEAARSLGIAVRAEPAVGEPQVGSTAMSFEAFRQTLGADSSGTEDHHLAARLVSVLDGLAAGTALGGVTKIDANGFSVWAEAGRPMQTTESLVRSDPERVIRALYEHASKAAEVGHDLDLVREPALSASAPPDTPEGIRHRLWEAAKGFFFERQQAASTELERHRLAALGGRVETWVFAQKDDVLGTLDGRGVEALVERAVPREALRLLGSGANASRATTTATEQPSLLM